jgi:hypothetical protein
MNYEIHYSRPRANRGLKAWGIFEIVSPSFSRGIAAYETHAEAEEALARLQRAPKGSAVAETSVEG